MNRCPFCGSEDIYFSKKRKQFVCEDCDETFSEQPPETMPFSSLDGRLELFFSYGHDRNRILVERIKRDFEKRGHHVWIDTSEIKTGDHWRDTILNGVLNASSVIAFLSEHSTRNPGVCLDELKIAVCVRGADIKTVLLEPENLIKPPATVADIQWLDMSDWFEMKKTSAVAFEQWYREKFAELCQSVEASDTTEIYGDIHTLKTKLKPYLNSEKEYQLLSKEYHGRKWLDDYIEDWQDNRSTKSLVLYGRPGSGKSAFSVNYSHFNSDVYGCFLCEWNREYTINPNRLIRTMAFRLATKLPDYRSMLLRQLDTDVNLEGNDPETLFDYLLTYPLVHLVDGKREAGIIVVDGMDEAEVDGENQIAAVFSKCVERLPRWIRFIFTSRPEKNVTKYFQASESLDIINDMPKGYNDIMAFLVKALADELRLIPNKLELLYKMCELSDGIFLYAEMLVTDIKNGFIHLSDVGTFPKGLNAFYRLSMERKFTDQGLYINARGILELLSITETMPEELIAGVLGQSQYEIITCLDKLGSWINRYKEGTLYMLDFSHKSLRDWLSNRDQSGEFYVDSQSGAIKLARFCRKAIETGFNIGRNMNPDLRKYVKTHVSSYYISSAHYFELEEFLCNHSEELDPFWRIWNQFPPTWDHLTLLNSFWKSHARNTFLRTLQREGNASYLLWFFNLAEQELGIKAFDKELISVYMDIVHISGEYKKAVLIAEQYLNGNESELTRDPFLAMLCVRRLHHSMFYKPTKQLIDDAIALYSQVGNHFPSVCNELLFLIGGNLGVLFGDWEFCREWLKKSVAFAEWYGIEDYKKRNSRKMADYYCHFEKYSMAEKEIKDHIEPGGKITGRYEAYLVGALANVYTCNGSDDEALSCYEALLKYTSAKGIPGWAAHAHLGIANVYFKLGNVTEANTFAARAMKIYQRIHQEWGLIMSEALLAACESRINSTSIQTACDEAIKHAEKMQYGSCAASIKEFCKGSNNFLKLYYL